MPVLTDDHTVSRAKDEAKGEGGDDRIVELPGDRHEVGDEVDRRREPESSESEHDLRADRDAPVAKQAGEETYEIRKDERELAREEDATGDDECHGDDDPDHDKDEKDLGPERKIHVVSSRSPAPRVRSGSSQST